MPLKFHNPGADLFVPDGARTDKALARTTHLGIGAHQDDLEIMAFHGIAECFGKRSRWFTGVTCTDGAGSPRSGKYARFTDSKMREVRRMEQRKAARIGEYSAMIQLGYNSSELRDPRSKSVMDDLFEVVSRMKPEIVYTHNPADRHDTHLAVVARVLDAIRRLPPNRRPKKVYGCEVWRSLDWIPEPFRVELDVSGRTSLARRLLNVFDSQISGGKRYDEATLSRWRANATYADSHAVDRCEHLMLAVDLTPLLKAPKLDLIGFVDARVREMKKELLSGIRKISARPPPS